MDNDNLVHLVLQPADQLFIAVLQFCRQGFPGKPFLQQGHDLTDRKRCAGAQIHGS